MAKVYIIVQPAIELVDENTARIQFLAQASVPGAPVIGFGVAVDFGDGANAINNKIVAAVTAEYALAGVTIGPTDKKIVMGSATVI